MIIGVLSDSHRNKRTLDKVFDIFIKEKVDHVFHLGDHSFDVEDYDLIYDIPISFVDGNTDFGNNNQLIKAVELDGIRFLLTHGHTLDVRNTLTNLKIKAIENECKVALYGHTHKPYRGEEDGILILNPGSISEPRGGSSKSFGLIHTKNGKIEIELRTLP